jgi:hypothetical protein
MWSFSSHYANRHNRRFVAERIEAALPGQMGSWPAVLCYFSLKLIDLLVLSLANRVPRMFPAVSLSLR